MPSPVDTIPQTTNDFAAFKELLYHLVVVNKYQRVLETGTDVGDSTRIFSTALQVTQGQLMTVDIQPPKGEWAQSWPVKNIQFITGDSTKLRLRPDQQIDLLFLDAHAQDTNAYEHVKTELLFLGTAVRPGGKIVLDDLYHSQFGDGIRKALEEFCRTQNLVFTVYPQEHGLGIIEVTHPLPRPTNGTVTS